MRGLIACFTVVCLALASAAPSAPETVSLVTKNYNFDKKDIIYSLKGFANDDLVYAVCEGSDADKKCTLYLETTNKEKSNVQSCDLNLKYEGKYFFHLALTNAGNSKAIVAVKDGDKIKLISVNLKGCDIKEASIDAPQKVHEPVAVTIVAHENSYDVLFANEKLCNDNLCKATFGYDGKVVKAAASFPVKRFQDAEYQVLSSKDSYLVSVSSDKDESTNVYLIDKDQKSSTLFSGKRGTSGLCVEENKLGFCVHSERKEVCKQYDADGKTKKTEVEVQTGEAKVFDINVLNLEKGFLALNIGQVERVRQTFLVRFDEEGKQQKYINLDVKCDFSHAILPTLYKSSNGEYCVANLCLTPLDDPKPHYDFTRNSRCFSHAELF